MILSPNNGIQHSAREGMGPLKTTGRGIGVAVLDSGISPHPDLDDRVLCAVSTVPGSPGTSDFLGHGTHVASLAVGNGAASRGEFCGVAPEANLISVRVTSGEEAQMTPEERYGAVVAGLRWAIENRQRYNIRVVNLSMGYPLAQSKDHLVDPLGKAITEAAKAGLVMVVAAGNEGDRPGTLCKTPAIHPDVITVGSSDGDKVARFSSRGPGPGKGMPDLLAPGINLMGANVAFSLAESRNDRALEQAQLVRTQLRGPERDRLLTEIDAKPTACFMPNGHPGYIAMQGTSMSAPLVAGVVACMLEANPFLSPQEVKDILKGTAHRLKGADQYAQGAGLMDADAAIAEAARRLPRT
ncbi:MAG: S8 family serine peptidase [Vulcanimicrobiota bacterium]